MGKRGRVQDGLGWRKVAKDEEDLGIKVLDGKRGSY